MNNLLKQPRIWTNGCFDVIHRGHIECLKFAKSLGGHLIVGIDSDARVKAAKGELRPYNKLVDRMCVLGAIRYVDEVRPFTSDEMLEGLVKEIAPDYFVKGSDYRGKKIIGAEYASEVVYFDLVEEQSTTETLNKIWNTKS
jgi:D-beta-D-heptose 7-phosphate kinase/D-beta-D-heptose 1-phosphate adenosyltransferase